MKTIRLSMMVCAMGLLSGCSSVGAFFNPFYETPSEVAYFGEKNDNALNETGGKGQSARMALEQMASYQRAHDPQPANPVMMPSVVRLMWVPDHLNSHGDLVPAHYYYLKVKKDSWALTDAFELESQLGGGNGNSSSVGYVSPEDVR
jgi:hypothetical protein